VRADSRKGDRTAEDLGGEAGCAEGHVINTGQSGASSAGDQQPSLGAGHVEQSGEDRARCAAEQLGRGLPSQRCSHSHHDLGDDRGAEASGYRKLPGTGPDGVVDLSGLTFGEST
jgi:hypothetical protein